MMKSLTRLAGILLTIGISAAVINARGTVGSLPRFKQKPIHDVVALVGRSHKFQCKVKGSPKPVLTWYRGNERIVPNEKTRIEKYSLKVFKLNMDDSGDYACKATNDFGELWGNFSLQVVLDEDQSRKLSSTTEASSVYKGPPEFKKRLNQVGYLARAATTSVDFDCDVNANPDASITWWKNGVQMKEEAGKYIIHYFKLTVESLHLDDKGDYTCVVSNEYGSVNWTTKLEVQRRVAIAPIMEDVKNQTALTGATVNFTCQIVMSDSEPLLQWLRHFKKNDSFVNERGEPYVKVLQSAGFKSTIADPTHLVLHNVTKEDEGWYTCLVANTVGMNYRSAWLTVKESNCTVNNGDCVANATCEGSEESLTCTCNPGYKGDGSNCTNIDECSELLYPCHEGYVCEDREPGYFCTPDRHNQRRPT